MEKNFFERGVDRVKAFVKIIDVRSWPAFFMFLIVLTAAGGLNYIGLLPIVGEYTFVAVAIAAFFGIGVLSWHIVESRTDDSEDQELVAQVVKWTNAVLDGILLIVNLFRADGGNGDIIAFIIIGLSAASHVVGYLMWTQFDEGREIRRQGERGLKSVSRKRQSADNVIAEAEAELSLHKWVMDEERRLRTAYKELPAEQVNGIVSRMRNDAYAKFAKKHPTRQQEAPRQAQMVIAVSDTEKAELQPNPTSGSGSK